MSEGSNIVWKIFWICWIWFLSNFLLIFLLRFHYLCSSSFKPNVLMLCLTWFWIFKNYISPFFQFTSGLYLTNQSCPRNMSVPLRSITTTLICFLCLLISISNGAILVTSPFLVLSTLNTSKKKSTSFVCILLFLTNC